ncbi:MAG: hypothetical protein LBK82_00165 [Planctomycetaceae bacterium]|jgi:hypothetical protein|nr:hypothetical protein [Planctomycetaceae bacterium]
MILTTYLSERRLTRQNDDKSIFRVFRVKIENSIEIFVVKKEVGYLSKSPMGGRTG